MPACVKKNGLSLIILLSFLSVCAQQNTTVTTDRVTEISNKTLKSIDKKYTRLTASVDNQVEKLLTRMQLKEERLRKKLQSKDSTKAASLFSNAGQIYQQLQSKLKAPLDKAARNPLREYILGLDSLQTAMRFLEQGGNKLPLDKLNQVKQISNQLHELQGKLQQANEIQAFVRRREQELKEQLTQYGLHKELMSINKQVVYYQQQLVEYKSLLNDRKKLEAKAISMISEVPAFKQFMQQNSYLAQLFGTPGTYGTPQALEGLQTRAQIEGMISQRLGLPATPASSGSSSGEAFMQQQVQQAQAQTDELKNKLNQIGGGSSEMTMPDFKPNNQRTKSIFQRIEYGLTIQTTGAVNYLPTIADLSVNLGYKLSDKAVMGIGAGYKLGLGKGWDKLALSNEGVSLRSYMDIKAKGSIWISGGFEYNYMQSFTSLRSLPSPIAQNINLWQHSALAGITKKYKIGKKKEGKMQLLYDFLAGQQLPKAQALKFRVGWNF
ncbi:hypothetical protein QTN47_22555 [Danxiaibacter flavus]|uniref:Uncharacterized protein n=1 Tax=Danxiaibacter flavus TaxID=3049108 RepID=A0ABV3ZK90_9BACT|nr:hypothetical protein QNM32_22560 [Chitinophagaceae bacterium DXS]